MFAKAYVFVYLVCMTKGHDPTNATEPSFCPDVSSSCYDTSWCDEAAQTYFYLEDGTKCQGCVECMPVVDKCPEFKCPMLDIPPDCSNPTFYPLYIDFGGRECETCDTLVCD